VADAAELLGVSPATVRAHLRQGTLVGEKIENQWVVYLAGTAPSPVPAVGAEAGQDRVVTPAPLPAATSSRPSVLLLSWLIRLLRRLRYTARRVRS
jgi:hypothetical protein